MTRTFHVHNIKSLLQTHALWVQKSLQLVKRIFQTPGARKFSKRRTMHVWWKNVKRKSLLSWAANKTHIGAREIYFPIVCLGRQAHLYTHVKTTTTRRSLLALSHGFFILSLAVFYREKRSAAVFRLEKSDSPKSHPRHARELQSRTFFLHSHENSFVDLQIAEKLLIWPYFCVLKINFETAM